MDSDFQRFTVQEARQRTMHLAQLVLAYLVVGGAGGAGEGEGGYKKPEMAGMLKEGLLISRGGLCKAYKNGTK